MIAKRKRQKATRATIVAVLLETNTKIKPITEHADAAIAK